MDAPMGWMATAPAACADGFGLGGAASIEMQQQAQGLADAPDDCDRSARYASRLNQTVMVMQ